MSELGETPGNKTIRLTKEKRITDHFKANDMRKVDEDLDTYAYGQRRPELSAAEVIAAFPRLGRLFRRELEQRAKQDTEEIPIVTPDMLDAA